RAVGARWWGCGGCCCRTVRSRPSVLSFLAQTSSTPATVEPNSSASHWTPNRPSQMKKPPPMPAMIVPAVLPLAATAPIRKTTTPNRTMTAFSAIIASEVRSLTVSKMLPTTMPSRAVWVMEVREVFMGCSFQTGCSRSGGSRAGLGFRGQQRRRIQRDHLPSAISPSDRDREGGAHT
ncbi:hypothetical protein HMPREF1043_0021, partial [Streptococcus anginosus subsp. whileyi CCUG 39159]